MKNETESPAESATIKPEGSPGAVCSITWQRWQKPVTYKWTFGRYFIVNDGRYWNLYLGKKLLFGDQDLQVVQEWAADYIKSNA